MPPLDQLLTAPNLIALVTLAALEIVLGVDNIIVIAIVTSRLPQNQQAKARFIGLSLAMVMRVGLLLAIGWVMSLTASIYKANLFSVDIDLSWKDLILIFGGLFLIFKATKEIHHDLEAPGHLEEHKKASSFSAAISMIVVMDLIFSLDSVITAVGMAKEKWIMIAAVVLAVVVMMAFAGKISDFVKRHPTIKVLALSFLILVGVLLIADGFDQHISRGYVYFAMAFSLVVEIVNIRIRKAQAERHAP